MNLERTYTIFKDDYGKYKIGLSHKTMDNKIEYASFPVRFRKGVEPENKTRIYIKKYWLDFYNWEYNGKKGTSFYIFVSEFTTIDDETKPAKEILEKKEDPYIIFAKENGEELDGMELPF